MKKAAEQVVLNKIRIHGKHAVFCLLLFLSVNSLISQNVTNEGTDFWIAFPPNSAGGGTVTLFISSNYTTSGKVTSAFPGVDQPFNVVPGVVTQLDLPSGVQLSGGTESKGIHITSADPIAVYGLIYQTATTDAYLALPVPALGPDYTIMSDKVTVSPSCFSVVATQDGTFLTIFNHQTAVVTNVTLDQGQTYHVQAGMPGEDLTGSRVQSNFPAGVGINVSSNLYCVSFNPATSGKIGMITNPVPVVSFTYCFDSITRVNAKPIRLKGGIPLGGTYSGPGVNSSTGIFTPSSAGTGTKTITCSYTNFTSCTAARTKTIIVQSSASFTFGNNLTDIRDNKVYPTIQIGSHCWMATNLDHGSQISETLHQRDNCVPEKYKSAVGSSQSSFYQWDEVMQYQEIHSLQGLCPPAWHVPTETEWSTLFANWTNNGFAGSPLKYSGYSGFNALLTGIRSQNVQWTHQNFATFCCSSTPYGELKALSHGMNEPDPSVSSYYSMRSNAFPVRCIRDRILSN